MKNVYVILQPLSFSVFQLTLGDEQCEVTRNGCESKELVYLVHIYCQVRQRTGIFIEKYRHISHVPQHAYDWIYCHCMQTLTQTHFICKHTHTQNLFKKKKLKLVSGDFQPTNNGSVEPVDIQLSPPCEQRAGSH